LTLTTAIIWLLLSASIGYSCKQGACPACTNFLQERLSVCFCVTHHPTLSLMAAQKLKLFFDDAIPDYDEVPDEIENNVSSKYVSVATLPYPKERKHKPNPDATYAVVDKTPKVSYIDGKLGLNYACMVRFCFHESLSYFAPRCLRDLCHEMFFLTNLYLAIHYYPLHFYNPLTLQMISNDKTAHKYNRKP